MDFGLRDVSLRLKRCIHFSFSVSISEVEDIAYFSGLAVNKLSDNDAHEDGADY